LETAGGEDDAESDPETTIRGESSGTKGVSDGHFPVEKGDQHQIRGEKKSRSSTTASPNLPHARKQLNQATIPKGDSHHDIRLRNPPRPHIDQTQHKRREGKSTQSQRRRVRKLTVLDLTVSTRLELSAKGWQARGAIGLGVSEGAIAETGGCLGGLVLLVGHFALDTVVAHVGTGAVLFVEPIGTAIVDGILEVRAGGHFVCGQWVTVIRLGSLMEGSRLTDSSRLFLRFDKREEITR